MSLIAKISRRFKCYSKKMLDFFGFIGDYIKFKNLPGAKRLQLSWRDWQLCLTDKTLTTLFDAHYIYHPAWAARILAKTKPVRHIDIASTLNFCAIVSAFVPIDFYDYRPAKLTLTDLRSAEADLLALPFADGSVASLSCMHTLEHIGLGRYGDKLDPEGDLKAMRELRRVLAPGGDLLVVVPVGRPKIKFNAHRIYSFEQIKDYFTGLDLKDFSLVTDQNDFISPSAIDLVKDQVYGCGCFWFKKSL